LDVFIGNLPSNIGFETVFNLAKKVGTVVGVVVSPYLFDFITYYLCPKI
jgi:hypothetical protein